MFQEVKKTNEFIPKGDYIVWIEYNDDCTADVYSTDSIFWRDFFSC